MSSDSNATERLRKLLDERDIKWINKDVEGISWFHQTMWRSVYDATCLYTEFEFANDNHTKLTVIGDMNLTPEQAVAATLGAPTLTAEQVRECAQVVYFEGYSDGSVNKGQHLEETNWQAIADELNAELNSGTCCLHYGEDDDGYDGWYCDECGGWFQAARRDGHLVEPKHCQECGKAVKR